MNSKRIGHVWFNGRRVIGVVLCKDPVTGILKSWIGVGAGHDSTADLKDIQEWGNKFDPDTALLLIRRHGQIDVSPVEFEQAVVDVNLETFEEVLVKHKINKGPAENNGG